MTELERRALLPDGLRDMLPPTAGFEADVIERLIGHFARHGYALVKAPLVEFEDGLLSGAGAAMSGLLKGDWNALAWLANLCVALGEGLCAGEIITLGTCTGLTPVSAGDVVSVNYGALGTVELAF